MLSNANVGTFCATHRKSEASCFCLQASHQSTWSHMVVSPIDFCLQHGERVKASRNPDIHLLRLSKIHSSIFNKFYHYFDILIVRSVCFLTLTISFAWLIRTPLEQLQTIIHFIDISYFSPALFLSLPPVVLLTSNEWHAKIFYEKYC